MKLLALCALVIGLASCSNTDTVSKFQTYNGPAVTHIVVNKTTRRMFLLHDDKILKDYDVDLGFAPAGHKQFEGDGKTPEGTYHIDRRNPNSSFYLSLGISYPNKRDIAKARAAGQSPGGDIFIHGEPNGRRGSGPDWTAGCISVTNAEAREIYAMVKTGTLITIHP